MLPSLSCVIIPSNSVYLSSIPDSSSSPRVQPTVVSDDDKAISYTPTANETDVSDEESLRRFLVPMLITRPRSRRTRVLPSYLLLQRLHHLHLTPLCLYFHLALTDPFRVVSIMGTHRERQIFYNIRGQRHLHQSLHRGDAG
jgi:hypothetical protein